MIFTCVLNKDFKIVLSTSTHKEQFSLKLKTIKKSNNRLISGKRLELLNIYLTSINRTSAVSMTCVVAKRIKKRIKKNKFNLVNMGAETNAVCTLKEEGGDSEDISSLNISQIQIPNSVTGKFLFSTFSSICQL